MIYYCNDCKWHHVNHYTKLTTLMCTCPQLILEVWEAQPMKTAESVRKDEDRCGKTGDWYQCT